MCDGVRKLKSRLGMLPGDGLKEKIDGDAALACNAHGTETAGQGRWLNITCKPPGASMHR